MKGNEPFLHDNALEFLKQSLEINKKGKGQIVCLVGDSGAGKSTIIRTFLSKALDEEFMPLFHFNPIRKEENAGEFLYDIFFYLWDKKDELIRNVKEYFYTHTRNEIKVLEKKGEKRNQQVYDYYYSIVPEILRDFIFMINQKKHLVLVFENIELYSEQTLQWLADFEKGLNHPITVIMTTSRRKLPEILPPTVQLYTVAGFNVKQTEKFIRHLVRNEINAKIITNYIYLKTQGNPALIRAIVTLWFSQPFLYEDGILQSRLIQANAIPLDWENLWSWYFTGVLDLRPILYLYFFRKKADYSFWTKMFRQWNMMESFQQFLDREILIVEKNLGKKFLTFYHPSVEEYIRLAIADETISDFLEREMDKTFVRKNLGIVNLHPALLSIISDELSLRKITGLIDQLYSEGKYNEVIQFLVSIQLLPWFRSVSAKMKKRFFVLLAELYEKQGKNDNALHFYRLLLDMVKREPHEENRIQLKIANLLLKTDRYEEASYLLKHLLNDKGASEETRAEASYLLGEMVFRNQQNEKAVDFLEEALRILKSKKKEVPDLIARIYLKLASVNNSLERYERALLYLEEAQKIYSKRGEIAQPMKIGLFKIYLWTKIYDKREALHHILREYKKFRNFYAPGIMETFEKQIAELYWQVGKWQYAREYYSRLYQFFTWRGDLYNASFMLGNMATIEKEIGQFGRAIRLEERALRLEHISQNILAMVYSYLNLGHLYVMIGAFFPASEQLNKALHLAEKNELYPEMIQAHLILAYLYCKQKLFEKAWAELTSARELIDLTEDEWGWTNYLFYRAFYLVEKGSLNEAESAVELFLKKTSHIVKYQATGKFLQGMILMRKEDWTRAIPVFQEALKLVTRYNFPYWKMLIAFQLALAFEQSGQGLESEKMLGMALQAMIAIHHSLEDRILGTQFLESGDVMKLIDQIKKIPQLNLQLVQWQIENSGE